MLQVGDRGEDVRTLQESLAQLGYRPGKVDGIFGEKTEDALIRFQEAQGILADGTLSTQTQEMLERALSEQVLEQQSPGVDSLERSGERLPFVRVPADAYRDGYDRFFLRSDVAEAYTRVRDVVVEAGGKLTSSGARRSLTAHVSPSRSATSFHYTGRALDLMVGSGMEAPSRDPYVVAADGDRRWRVYARAEGAERREVEAVTYGSRTRGRPVEGHFLDLTALFESEGFARIRARKSFFSGGTWLGAEWWHFQYERGLEPGVSTFGGELLRVYSEDTLRETPPWRFRDRVFGRNWG
ncbi:MAG: peptidoglycan-binding domain-containing protein [Myxococcota bacterium]|nr:peptidoglycan-binding domain-containing protein [Myxococcota bacterium]